MKGILNSLSTFRFDFHPLHSGDYC